MWMEISDRPHNVCEMEKPDGPHNVYKCKNLLSHTVYVLVRRHGVGTAMSFVDFALCYCDSFCSYGSFDCLIFMQYHRC